MHPLNATNSYWLKNYEVKVEKHTWCRLSVLPKGEVRGELLLVWSEYWLLTSRAGPPILNSNLGFCNWALETKAFRPTNQTSASSLSLQICTWKVGRVRTESVKLLHKNLSSSNLHKKPCNLRKPTLVYQETKKTHQVQRSFIITMYEREGLILLLWSGIPLENSLEHKIYCSGMAKKESWAEWATTNTWKTAPAELKNMQMLRNPWGKKLVVIQQSWIVFEKATGQRGQRLLLHKLYNSREKKRAKGAHSALSRNNPGHSI